MPPTSSALRAPSTSAVAGWLRHPAVWLSPLLAFLLAQRLGQTINNDVAWTLHSAAALLDGGRLYETIFVDVNPPLMVYLAVPGALLALLTGWFAADAYVLTVFAAIVLSLWLAARLLAERSEAERITILLSAALTLGLLPAGDFGQRPHLMLILALPYLLLLARRLEHPQDAAGPLLASAIGAAAGLGFAIKPHYLLLPAALEALLLARHRRPTYLVRPETLALAAVVALYALSIALLTPEYLTRIVPYGLAVYNQAYANPLGVVLFRPETLLVPAALLAHWRARLGMAPWQAALGNVLALAAFCFFVSYVVQMKGWNYHIYPTTAALVMLAGCVLVPAAPARPLRLCAAALAGLLLARTALVPGNHYPLMERLLPVVRAHAAGDAIQVLSTNVWTGFPLALYAGVDWASRSASLWLLPGVVRGALAEPDRTRLAEIDRYATDSVIADLAAHRPALIIVDVRPRQPDFVGHFATDPRFAALWSEYAQIGEIDSFEIWRRRDAPLPERTS